MITINIWLTYDTSFTSAFKGSIDDVCTIHFTEEDANNHVESMSGEYEIFEDQLYLTKKEASTVIKQLLNQAKVKPLRAESLIEF